MSEQTNICLNMIVRNETGVLGRCFASLKDFIDYYVIVDTGSIDRTPDFIRETMTDYGIEGEVHSRTWKNFGENRQEALELALKANRGDWLLFIDADEELVCTNPGFYRSLVPGQSYYLYKYHGALRYGVPHLVDVTANQWNWQGRVHNKLTSVGDDTSFEILDAIGIIYHSEEGAKSHGVTTREKYLRDALVLEEEIEADPENTRAWFLLGQSYRDAKEFARAHAAYCKRAGMGGPDEEVFVAFLEAGKLSRKLGHPVDQAVAKFQAARDVRPTRAEPLYELALLYREKGRYQEAWETALEGTEIPIPDDLLYVAVDVYEWRLLEELALAAYITRRFSESVSAYEQILERIETKGIAVAVDDQERIFRNLADVRKQASKSEPGMFSDLSPGHEKLKIPKELSRSLRSKVKSDYWKKILAAIENRKTEIVLNELKKIDQKQGLFKLPHPFFENLDTWAVGSIREGMCNYIFFTDENHRETWAMCQCTDFVDAICSKDFSGKHQVAPADAVFLPAESVFWRMTRERQKKINFTEHQELAGYRLDQVRPYHHFYDHLKWLIAIDTKKSVKRTQSFYIPSSISLRDQKNKKTAESYLFPAVIGSNQLGMAIDKRTLNMESAIIRDVQDSASMKVSRIKTLKMYLARLLRREHITIWHGISGQKRTWIEQANLVPALVDELQDDYRTFTFIIDGHTDYDYQDIGEGEHETPQSVLEDQEIFRSIQNAMSDYENVTIESVIGMTYKEKIMACCNQVDFFIANAGAGQLVPHRFCKKQGILHSNESHCVFPSGIQGNDLVQLVPKSKVKDVGNIFENIKHRKGSGFVSYSIEPSFVARLAKSMLLKK